MTDSAEHPASHPAAAPQGTDIWSRLWSLLAGRWTWLWIAPALAAAALTVILPQMPNAAATDATVREVWLAATRARVGPIADPLAALGLWSIERAPAYRILLVASLFSVLLSLYEHTRGLAARRAAPVARQAESFFAEPNVCSQYTSPAPPEAALERVAASLSRWAFRITREKGTGVAYLAADRWIGYAAGALARLGLGVLIAGLIWTAANAWRGSMLLTPEQSAPLPSAAQQAGDVVRVDGLDAEGAQVVVNRAGRDVAQGRVGPGRPWWFDGTLVFLAGDGPAVRITGKDHNGQPVQLESCPACAPATAVTLVLGPDTPERSAFAPGQALIVVAERGAGTGTPVHVTVLTAAGDRPVQAVSIADAGDVAVDQVVFHVTVARYVALDLYRAPGLPLSVAGLLVAVCGGLLARALPPRGLCALAAAEEGATTVKIATDDPSSAKLVAQLGTAPAGGDGVAG